MVKFYLSQSSVFSFSAFLKRVSIAILLFLLVQPVIAQQQKKNYTLLWRISGKGLAKPSYLFGTMHVKDKRAFAFSDSVMLAIQNTSAFALEVQPDTLIKTMFNMIGERDSSRSLRKWLSPAEYAKLAKRFKAKKGYDMGNMDPMSVESALRPQNERPDDKPGVLDAYLYGVARGMGKEIYGLENTAEQFDSYFGLRSNIKERVENLVDEDKGGESVYLNGIEDMIRLYNAGNLDAMRAFLSEDQLENDELVARNKVMFSSIVNRIDKQSMFSAVGAAHLPGKHGLIALLRDAGYNVTPVKADFTGVADKFNADFTKLNWKSYSYAGDGFAIKLPFEPIKTKILNEMPTVIYADISNEVFMGVYATKVGSAMKPADIEKIFGNMTANFKKKSDERILSQSTSIIKGNKTREMTVLTKGQTMRVRITVVNDFMYMLYAGLSLKTIHSPYVNRFFDSFETFKPAAKVNPTWIGFKDDTAAFAVHLPGNPKPIVKSLPQEEDSVGEPYRVHLFMSVDTANLENYIVRYNDYPKGTYLSDTKSLFENMNQLFGNVTKVIKEPRKIIKEGYEGREEDIIIAGKYYCRAQLLVRGNRTYVLLRQNLQAGAKDDNVTDDFFESFKLLPYNKPEMDQYTIDGGNFTAGVFQKVKTVADSADIKSYFKGSVTTYSTNLASAGLYGMEHTIISPYYRTKSVDSIYYSFTHKRIKYTDTLLKDDTITVNGLKGHEFITKNKATGIKKRNRIFIDNGDLFVLTGYLAEEELYNDASNQFYNSLRKIKPTAAIDLASSKADKIVEGLSSADTSIFKLANAALSYYDFEKNELPYVYKALEKTYTNDSTYQGTTHKLVQVLDKTHDDKTIDVLASVYKNPAVDADAKPLILPVITGVDKQKGYITYLDLLTNQPAPKAKYNYSTFEPLNDSLRFAVDNYDRIIPLLRNDEYRPRLLSVFQSMASDKGGKYADFLRNHFKEITAFANADMDKYLSKEDSVSNTVYLSAYYYLSLMQKIKGQAITPAFTARLIRKNDVYKSLPNAVITRLKNHLPVDQLLINRLLDSLDQRYDLMQALNEEKQLTRVPAKYKTQAAFAKLCVYQNAVATDDEDVPEHIKPVGTFTDKGHLFYVFSYNSTYDDEGNHQLAICGPFTAGLSRLDFTSYNTYYEQADKTNNWQTQARKMVVLLKKQKEEELASATDK